MHNSLLSSVILNVICFNIKLVTLECYSEWPVPCPLNVVCDVDTPFENPYIL
jgi:hypothetical protein